MPVRANRTGSICFAANDLAYLVRNGGVGTYFWLTTRLLGSRGWKVHILYCEPDIEDPRAVVMVRQRLREAGVSFSTLEDHPGPEYLNTDTHPPHLGMRISERVRHALEELHAEHHFDLIEFADWRGAGFRTIQARRVGTAFQDVRLMVKMHGSSEWGRQGNHQWLSDPDDLRTDFIERYAFEHADVQLAPCRYMLDYARGAGWNVRPDAQVCGYAYPEPKKGVARSNGEVTEIVFFGRLEIRKGLEIFLDALEELPTNLPVTFLGKDTQFNDGPMASSEARRRLAGRHVNLLLNCNQEQAVAYLRGPGRLAVMPSLVDNYPFTVIECATQGIPFLASSVGGIPEMLDDAEVQQRLLFEPKSPALRRCLSAYLEAAPAQRAVWQQRASQIADIARNNDRLVEEYERILESSSVTKSRGQAPCFLSNDGLNTFTRTSVVVTHYNLGDYLPENVASLAAQDYGPLEVIIVDDGSTYAKSRQVFAEQSRLYPNFRWIEQSNAGCGAARNRGLAEATGEFVVFMDADNVARPNMVRTMAAGLARNPDLSALSCYVLAFLDDTDRHTDPPEFLTTFTGGPFILAATENVYGDTNSIFRVAALRSIGGFEDDRSTPWEDWITFVKLAAAGHSLDVLPEVLFDYRVRGAGRRLALNRGRDDQYELTRDLLRKCFLNAVPAVGLNQAQLWTALVSFRAACDQRKPWRYKAIDHLYNGIKRIPLLHKSLKSMQGFFSKFGKRSA